MNPPCRFVRCAVLALVALLATEGLVASGPVRAESRSDPSRASEASRQASQLSTDLSSWLVASNPETLQAMAALSVAAVVVVVAVDYSSNRIRIAAKDAPAAQAVDIPLAPRKAGARKLAAGDPVTIQKAPGGYRVRSRGSDVSYVLDEEAWVSLRRSRHVPDAGTQK